MNFATRVSRALRDSSDLLAWAALAMATVVYLFLAANTPMVIMVWQAYDDALFVRLGRALSEGRWLGPYDALTLAKGPGYPAFLAASYWSGLPVTLAHAGLYCLSLGALAWVAFKKSGSYLLAIAFFVLPLFHPKILEPARVLRDSIYMSQSILVIAAFAYSLYVANGRRQTVSACVTGLLLGWFWLTREEGVWILPGLAVMVFFGWRWGRRAGATSWWRVSLLVFSVFVATQVLFALLNLFTYGKFVGVEFKESSFQGAISAMESIQPAKPVPFVAVPRATRMQIYDVSPDFASLRPILDPPDSTSPWEAGACPFRPTACGDIGNGFFMWAVRDAAERLGHFHSPEDAAVFFERIKADIDRACAAGKLRCKHDLIPMLPPLTDVQIARIPVALSELYKELSGPGAFPGYLKDRVIGSDSELDRTLSFLNHPQHYPKAGFRYIAIEVTGWYYVRSAGDEWFDLDVVDKSDPAIPRDFVRMDSPDISSSQHDDKASRQRFRISARCGEGCFLRLKTRDGKSLDLPMSKGLPARVIPVGNGILAFDPSSAVQYYRTVYDDIRVQLAYRLRGALYVVYAWIVPLLMAAGLLGFFVALAISIRYRMSSFALALACTGWVLVASRSVILLLVDISSFPAIHVPYLLPIYSFSLIAAISSIWASILVIGARRRGKLAK